MQKRVDSFYTGWRLWPIKIARRLDVDNEFERYLDFSSDESDVEAFRASGSTQPQLTQYANEIQMYIRHTNPISGIRGLIGLHAATTAGFCIGAGKSQMLTNLLLGIIALVLMYIAYQMS